jgi:hypothetical protein
MEDRSIQIVRKLLPRECVLREYRPDYGIDLSIEIFEASDGGGSVWEAMGETVFIQVKSTDIVRMGEQRVFPRRNVEKGALREYRSEHMDIRTVRYPLDTSELLTIQSMSAAVPVLLFVVELSTEKIYYVCLNDLIDKVILPADPEYTRHRTKTIHLPVRNRISAAHPISVRPVATFAKRPKLYAAFEKFGYQQHELGYGIAGVIEAISDRGREEAMQHLVDLARHFLAVDLRYDFWARMPEWEPIGWSFRELTKLGEFLAAYRPEDTEALREYLATPVVDFEALRKEYVASLDASGLHRSFVLRLQFIWHRLANLSRMYEEIAREWFLPTFLSHLLTEDLDPA